MQRDFENGGPSQNSAEEILNNELAIIINTEDHDHEQEHENEPRNLSKGNKMLLSQKKQDTLFGINEQ